MNIEEKIKMFENQKKELEDKHRKIESEITNNEIQKGVLENSIKEIEAKLKEEFGIDNFDKEVIEAMIDKIEQEIKQDEELAS